MRVVSGAEAALAKGLGLRWCVHDHVSKRRGGAIPPDLHVRRVLRDERPLDLIQRSVGYGAPRSLLNARIGKGSGTGQHSLLGALEETFTGGLSFLHLSAIQASSVHTHVSNAGSFRGVAAKNCSLGVVDDSSGVLGTVARAGTLMSSKCPPSGDRKTWEATHLPCHIEMLSVMRGNLTLAAVRESECTSYLQRARSWCGRALSLFQLLHTQHLRRRALASAEGKLH